MRSGIFHLYKMKDKEHKKTDLPPPALAFLQYFEIHPRDLLL